MSFETRTPRIGIRRTLAFAAVVLGYATASGLLACWLDGRFVVLAPALVIGGMAIGTLLGRTLLRPAPPNDEPGAPGSGAEPPRD